MSVDRHQADERVAAIATKYTSTGEHAKIPLTVCAAAPAANAFAYSRFCPEELDPISVCGHEPQQPD
jgi:hypothetical protein